MFDQSKKHDPADFYGNATKCQVCLPAVNIHHNFCQTCFNRGYVAQCTSCNGTGNVTEQTPWGNKSTMSSICHWCGGKGMFAVTKEYYDNHRDPEEEKRPKPQMPHLPEKAATLPDGQKPLLSATL
jgi:hypothetical protein